MNSVKVLILSLVFAMSTQMACADENEESFNSWDDIVTDLKADLRYATPQVVEEDGSSLDKVEISGGLGLAFTFLSLEGDPTLRSSGLLKGISAQFGINLLLPTLFAEGAFRSYSSENLSSTVNVGLREFELRLVHSALFQKETLFRIGAGISARYLDITRRNDFGREKTQYTTPSAVFAMGVARNFGKRMQIGPDLSYRSSMTGDTIDRSSVDLNLKFNARF